MKLKNTILALLMLCACFAWQAGAARPEAPRPAWEYKRVYLSTPAIKREDVDQRINELGAEGWELVTFQPNRGEIAFGLYVFKREK